MANFSKPLSPAAQAVKIPLNKILSEIHRHSRISFSPTDVLPITIETNEAGLQAVVDTLCAAALQTAMDHIVPPALEKEFNDRNRAFVLSKMIETRRQILNIAAELEGQQSTSSTH